MKKRFRSKPDKAVGKRLIKEARLARERAEQLPPSMEREALLKKARAVDIAANIEEWLDSPGLRSPK
jgi:phosphoenolpyruvate-protein kinase (PTS system EI component)